MLSIEQKEHLRAVWRCCPAQKKEIMADFVRENSSDVGWEAWLGFLEERLDLSGNVKTAGSLLDRRLQR